MSEKSGYRKGGGAAPQPVQAAQSVLAELQHREDYAALSKILPGFAMALHKGGAAVTEDGLRACAEKGADMLAEEMKALKTPRQQKKKTYDDVLEILKDRYVSDVLSGTAEDLDAFLRQLLEPEELFHAVRTACDNGSYKKLAVLTDEFVLSLTENTNHYDFRSAYYPGHAHAALIHALAASGGKKMREKIKPLTDDLLSLARCPFEDRLADYEESFTAALKAVCNDKILQKHGKKLICGAAKNGYVSAVRYLAEQNKTLLVALTEEGRFQQISESGHVGILEILDEYGVRYPVSEARADFMAPLYNAVKTGKTAFLDYCRRHHPDRIDEKQVVSGFCSAASNGHREILDYILQHYPDAITQVVLDETMSMADEMDEFEIWCFLFEKGAKPNYAGSYLLYDAAEKGDLDRIKTLHEKGLNPGLGNGEALVKAAKHGQFAVAEYLLDCGVSARSQGVTPINEAGQALTEACKYGHYDIAKLLLQRGAKPEDQFGNAMMDACLEGHTEIIKLLVDYGSPHFVQGYENVTLAVSRPNGLKTIRFLKEEMGADIPLSLVMEPIMRNDHYGILAYYQEIGEFKIEDAPEDKREKLQTGLENFRQWQRIFGSDTPAGLYGYSPKGLKKETFKRAQEILKKEGYGQAGYEANPANEYAYAAAYLFGTEDRMLTYLEKWGEAGKQPFHNIVHKIRMPKMEEKRRDLDKIVIRLRVFLNPDHYEEDEDNSPARDRLDGAFDRKAWGDAVLQHGPEMAKLLAFAGKMPRPERSDDGSTYSLQKTRAVAAKHIYSRGLDFPDLADLCLQYGWHERYFQKAVQLKEQFAQRYPAGSKPKKIPDTEIDGEKFGMEGYRFTKLPDGDLRGLFLGEIVDCCQHLAEAGAACATHGFLSENGGFYVLEDAKKNIVAQSWAWRGKEGELVLDSLESLKGRVAPKQWEKLCAAFAEQAVEKDKTVSAVLVGGGGETPKLAFNTAAALAVPADYTGYRDSRRMQYKIPTGHANKH